MQSRAILHEFSSSITKIDSCYNNKRKIVMSELQHESVQNIATTIVIKEKLLDYKIGTRNSKEENEDTSWEKHHGKKKFNEKMETFRKSDEDKTR